jgi:hypothetical protein
MVSVRVQRVGVAARRQIAGDLKVQVSRHLSLRQAKRPVANEADILGAVGRPIAAEAQKLAVWKFMGMRFQGGSCCVGGSWPR